MFGCLASSSSLTGGGVQPPGGALIRQVAKLGWCSLPPPLPLSLSPSLSLSVSLCFSLFLSVSLRTGCHIDATLAGRHCRRCHGDVYSNVCVCVCVGGRRHTHWDTPWCCILLCGGAIGNLIKGTLFGQWQRPCRETDAEGEMCHPPLLLWLLWTFSVTSTPPPSSNPPPPFFPPIPP